MNNYCLSAPTYETKAGKGKKQTNNVARQWGNRSCKLSLDLNCRPQLTCYLTS